MPDYPAEPLLTWTYDTLPANMLGELFLTLSDVAERHGFVLFLRESDGAMHVFMRPIRAEDVSMRASRGGDSPT